MLGRPMPSYHWRRHVYSRGTSHDFRNPSAGNSWAQHGLLEYCRRDGNRLRARHWRLSDNLPELEIDLLCQCSYMHICYNFGSANSSGHSGLETWRKDRYEECEGTLSYDETTSSSLCLEKIIRIVLYISIIV